MNLLEIIEMFADWKAASEKNDRWEYLYKYRY